MIDRPSGAAIRLLSCCLGLALASGCGSQPETYTSQGSERASYPERQGGAGRWPQWGGPNGDFKLAAAGLASSWPLEGPPLLWSRPLGAGYSAIAADAGVLFTMYRDEADDVVIALRADDGATIWERRYSAPTVEGNATQFGSGPHASPLVLEDRLVTLGYTGMLNCLDRVTGEVLWSHDLVGDFGAPVQQFGFSASPILHDGSVIVLVGGPQGAVAFAPADGSVAWKGAASSVSYATPIVADVDGQEQLIYFSADEVIGLDPANGTRLWSFPVRNQYDNNATGPIWGDDNLLWVATQLDGGTRALRLTRTGADTRVEEVWSSNKLSIHYWNALRLGDHVYASVGSNASVLVAVDIRTGETAWRERGFEQANFVHAGDKTVLLDADGQLALVGLSAEGLEIHSQAQIVEDVTWTVPTLVGTRLYVRDKKSIRALELGAGARSAGT